MGNDQFIKLVKRLVTNYFNHSNEDHDKITDGDVYIVWLCKTLQNNKALASTTVHDNMYYEITYDGDKRTVYFDAYKKCKNIAVGVD